MREYRSNNNNRLVVPHGAYNRQSARHGDQNYNLGSKQNKQASCWFMRWILKTAANKPGEVPNIHIFIII